MKKPRKPSQFNPIIEAEPGDTLYVTRPGVPPKKIRVIRVTARTIQDDDFVTWNKATACAWGGTPTPEAARISKVP